MYKRQNLEFDIMDKDKKVQHCVFDTETSIAVVTNYDNILPFEGLVPEGKYSVEDFDNILEVRCWDKSRSDTKEILEDLGLDIYNPYEIVKKTHAVDFDDWNWFLFTDESLKWEDVNPHRKTT